MYYVGQYVNAAGQAAPQDWQTKARACLAGNKSSSWATGGALSSSPCDNSVEWLNNSNESFNSGVEGLSAAGTGGSAFDVSNAADAARQANQRELFNFYANKIGGLQTFKLYTRNESSRDMVVSVEFTTHRVPWAGAQEIGTKRTFVAASYKSFDKAPSDWGGTYWQAFASKYKEFTDVDSDGDGLTDRFELGIGTCAFPKDSAEYANSTYCQGVENPKDTDGDGAEDGQEVTSTTPKATPTGFKIEGTDPTVAPQKPSNPAEPTGKRGEVISGTTKPYMTVELYDVTGKKLLGSTVADKDGKYELTVGKALDRAGINKYGNNIKFSDEDNRVPTYYDLPVENDITEGDTVAVNFWSDGMDNLGTSDTTRPQFSKPTGAIAIQPDSDPVEVEDPNNLTDEDKGKIKDEVKDLFPNAGDDNIVVNPDGSVTVTVPVQNPSTGEETTSVVTIPAEDVITTKAPEPSAGNSAVSVSPEQPVKGADATVDGTVKDASGEPIAGREVTVVVPQADGTTKNIPAKTDADGRVVDRTTGEPITFPAADGDVKVFDGDATDGTPIASTTVTTKAGAPDAGQSSVGTPGKTTVPVSDGTTDDGKTSFTVTLKDKLGNPVTGATDQISVTRADGQSLNDPVITDNGDGTYTVTVSSEKAGSSPLEVKAGETVIGQTPAVTFEPGEVDPTQSTAEVTRNNAAKVQDNRNESNQVTVTLKDKYGNPTDKGVSADALALSGAHSSFTVTPSKRDGETGVYDLTVRSTEAGDFEDLTPQLHGQDVAEPVAMTFVEPPADPDKSTVTVDTQACTTAVADGEDTCPVTVTLVGTDGKPIVDPARAAALGLTVTGPEGAKPTVSAFIYDPETQSYKATVTTTKAGDYTLTATSGGEEIGEPQAAHFVPGPLAQVTNPQGIPGVGGTPAGTAGEPVTNATVTVADKNDNPLPKGTEVYVTIPGVDEPVKATVGENGVAKLDPFTPTKTTGENGTAGDGTVVVYPDKDTATAGDPSKGVDTGETPVINAGVFDPASSTVDVTTGPKTVGDTHTVTVSLTDANGNPITGDAAQAALDTLEVSATDGTTSATVGTGWTPVEGKPGQYTTTVTSDKPGSFPVTVTSGEEQTPLKQGENTTATFATGGPANATIDGLTPTTVGGSIDDATVTVTDAKGNPVAAGTEVYVKIGAGDPVKATVGENGTVTLDGKDGQPGPITVTKDDVAAGSVPVVVSTDAKGADVLGRAALPVKASAPTGVTAVKHADGTVTVTATVPNAKTGETVTVKDQAGNAIGNGTVKDDGTVEVTVPADKATDATAVTVTAGSDATASEASQPAEVRDAVATPDEPTVTNKTDGTTEVAVHVDAPEGTTVTVTGPDGKPHTAKVDGNGNATVTLDPGLKAGDKVTVTAGDAPLTSAEVTGTAVDQTATPTDVVAVKKTDGSATVTGKAEPGSAVTVKVGDKEYPATARDDGSFEVKVPEGIPAGQTPSVTATGKDKAASEPATATSQTQLDTPTVSALTSPDGTTTTVSGKATPGQKVTVTAGGKTYTPEVKADGSYSFTTDEPLANGTELTAVAGEGLTASEPGKGSANTQTATPTAKAVTSEDGKTTTVSGTAEPGAKVTVTGPDGAEQTVTAREDGTYSVDFTPALKDGDSVKVTAQNGAEVPSEPATATAGTRLPAPTDVTAVTDPEGKTTTVTGTTTAPKDTPVEVTYTGTDGKQHTTTGKVGEDGTIKVDLTEPPAKDGTPVTVTVGSGDTASKPAEGVTAQTKAATPTVDSVVTDPAGTTDPKTTVSGTAKPRAKVTVKVGDKVVGETTANEDGSYTVPVSPALADKTVVTVTATEDGKVASDPATGTAVTKTAAPTVDSVVTTPAGKGTTVTGTAEPGTTVTVTGPDGKEHTTTAGEDGTYSITIEPGLKDGDTVTVTASKDGQAGSDATTGTATTQVATPTDVVTTTDPATGATTVTGKTDAKPGTTVTITDKAGNVVGTGTVNEDGTFSITTDPAQPGGTELNVTVGDKPVTSDPATVTAKYPAATDSVAIADPAAGTTKVDGKATGAADGTPVTVRNAKGEVIGTGEVKGGKFTVTAKPALPNGAVITVTVGTPNTSAASDLLKVTVQAIPAKPGDVDATVTNDGKGVTVTGTTDAGNGVTVTEKDGTVHQTVADEDGTFAVTVPGAKAGDELTVRVVRDGLVSETVTVTAHAADAGKAATGQSKPTVVGSLAKTGAAVGGLALLALASIALGAAVLRRREQA